MAEYKVQFEDFEGPLDLLLYLVKKEEVDIYEVNLTRIAAQFVEYLELMRELDLDVFVPMFMLLGYSPELVQAAYRVGDSVTNIISPMMSYFALIIAFINKYYEKAVIGTLIATMLPYTSYIFYYLDVVICCLVCTGITGWSGRKFNVITSLHVKYFFKRSIFFLLI